MSDTIYFTVYKTINKINGKFYIGTHKTNNLDDGYMGSGKYLKRSIKKNGIEAFEKEILYVFDNPEQMYTKEAEIVNGNFLAEENTYNLKVGGFGGWDYINNNEGLKNKAIDRCKEINKKIKGPVRATYGMKGKKHSKETKLKMSRNNGNKLNLKEIKKRNKAIKNSNITFHKFGWVNEVSNILGISPQKVNEYMKRYMPDFYENKCFKRKAPCSRK